MNMEEKPSQLEPISEVVVGETLYVPSYESFAVVRFVGTTEFGKGIWVGLELPTPSGKNSGSVKGKKYFPCQAQHGIFVRISACLRTIDTGATSNDVNPNIGDACLPPAPPEELHLSHEISPQGIKVLGSLTAAASDMTDSSDDEDDGDQNYSWPLSPPLNLSSRPADGDSEGELEVCIEEAQYTPASSVPSGIVSQEAAMEAYLAAEQIKNVPGLNLVAAMESSVNAIINQDPAYICAQGTLPAGDFGMASEAAVETPIVVQAEPDVFGIEYIPFKKTIAAASQTGAQNKTFEDEYEFEKDLQNSSILNDDSAICAAPTSRLDDEFDFEVDTPSFDPDELRRTLQSAAEELKAAEQDDPLDEAGCTGNNTGVESTSIKSIEDSGNYDAYGDAKDALQAIVDIYECGLGDQEIVIMNSLGADAVTTLTHQHHPPVSIGASIVPGTGTVPKGKSSKRSTGVKNVRTKIEREKIIEEDEEDYELREKELEEARAEAEKRERLEAAMLESEWQGVTSTPDKPTRRKSTGSSSPKDIGSSPRLSLSQLGSPVPPSPRSTGGGEESNSSDAYDVLLVFLKSQNLTQYHSQIVTSSQLLKGSWMLGGNVKLNFDGCDEQLKFAFSVAQVNYDPVRYREHFSALKVIYKFFVPISTNLSPLSTGRGSRTRDVGMVGSHWGNIGFQGLDPCTDINRSMKMLSVLQVLNLVQEYPHFAYCLYGLSQHNLFDEKGRVLTDLTWPFFCVSIGFTRDALQTLRGNYLNKRCNKFRSVLTGLHEFYRACFYTFAKDVLENPTVHHAHHISALRSAVENDPMNVLKAYKTFIKKKCARGNMDPQSALCSLFEGHPCGLKSDVGGAHTQSEHSPEKTLEAEDLEFAGLDEIKDNIDNRSSSPDKSSGGLFSLGRQRGYGT